MKKSIIRAAVAASFAGGLLATGIGAAGATAASPVPTSCAATAGDTCTFTVNATASTGATGYINGSNASFTIAASTSACVLTIGGGNLPSTGQPDGGSVSTDVNGNAVYTQPGGTPGAGSLQFSNGCTYTLTVHDGVGAVAAGQTN